MEYINNEIKEFIKKDVLERFLRYVQIDTASDDNSKSKPSSSGQRYFAEILQKELRSINIMDTVLDSYGYLYVTLPASSASNGPPITLCAHLDTSGSESGKDVKPKIHKNYSGKTIKFPDNKELHLTPDECPELLKFTGGDIITASGTTLLGADDKAGVAEIITALFCLKKFKSLKHSELRIVFTPDEEIGRGTEDIDLKRLGDYGYTIDGDQMGVIEDECFNAYLAAITFYGINVHPGYAKNKMVNAAAISSRFVAELPEYETPEHTENREGFYHLLEIAGDENRSTVRILLRDFEEARNINRIDYLNQLIDNYKIRYKGIKIESKIREQYKNMKEILKDYPEAVNIAEKAIERSGIKVIRKFIRGGTDGAKLTEKGLPTPNIFAGGMMFHSKKEWIPVIALQKASETILNLFALWAGERSKE